MQLDAGVMAMANPENIALFGSQTGKGQFLKPVPNFALLILIGLIAAFKGDHA